jgi:hypothetical protein
MVRVHSRADSNPKPGRRASWLRLPRQEGKLSQAHGGVNKNLACAVTNCCPAVIIPKQPTCAPSGGYSRPTRLRGLGFARYTSLPVNPARLAPRRRHEGREPWLHRKRRGAPGGRALPPAQRGQRRRSGWIPSSDSGIQLYKAEPGGRSGWIPKRQAPTSESGRASSPTKRRGRPGRPLLHRTEHGS